MKNIAAVGMFSVLAFALPVTSASIVHAAEYSWNLSRDMANGITTNPKGRWAFMADPSGTGQQANYQLLDTYNGPLNTQGGRVNVWGSIALFELLIGVPIVTFTTTIDAKPTPFQKGLPVMHPGSAGGDAIVRWTSPISGVVSVLGKFESMQKSCGGDGVNWSFKWGDYVIQSGSMYSSTASFSAQNLPVKVGTRVYVVVDSKGSSGCDWTSLDLFISGHN